MYKTFGLGQSLVKRFTSFRLQQANCYNKKSNHSLHKSFQTYCTKFKDFRALAGGERSRHIKLASVSTANNPQSKLSKLFSSNSKAETTFSNQVGAEAEVKQFEEEMCDKHLYPPIQPYNSGFLEVSTTHKLYFEECGNRDGIPIVYIHGGPGGGIGDRDRRYYDPEAYRIVLFDQRGAGKSTPAFCLEENDTWNLVNDIEKLRKHLEIDKWVVFGGSWGSTLSLVYAEKHIDRVLALVLRGIFTLRKEELAWFYQEGASFLFPDFWEEYVDPIPEEERGDFITAYYKRLTGDNEEEKLRCAQAWSKWEMATSQLRVNPENISKCADDTFSLAFARIECHYFVNKGFFPSPNHVIDNAKIIHESGIPVTIVQGRYDVVCPAKTAWELYKKLPNSEFHIVEDAGHSAKEDGITKRLVKACDKYKQLVQK